MVPSSPLWPNPLARWQSVAPVAKFGSGPISPEDQAERPARLSRQPVGAALAAGVLAGNPDIETAFGGTLQALGAVADRVTIQRIGCEEQLSLTGPSYMVGDQKALTGGGEGRCRR